MPTPSARDVTYLRFGDQDEMLSAARKLQENKIKIYDAYTPVPIEELDDIMHCHETLLGPAAFIASMTAGALIMYFQYWTSAVDWPINVGGKPMNPSWAGVPVAYEIFILGASMTAVGYLFFKEKLLPGKLPRHDFTSTSDKEFILVISKLEEQKVNEFAPQAVITEGSAQ